MDQQDIMTEILAADEARYRALYAQDTGSLSSLLRDDYLHIHANGRMEDRAAFLASIAAARYRFLDAQRSLQTVRAVGDEVAMLAGRTTTTIEVAGETKTMDNAFATVWVKGAQGWGLLLWQATRLAEA
jgi:ketosteroid isomerase-like protein